MSIWFFRSKYKMNINLKENTFKKYTTDGKVNHLSSEEDINVKIGKIIGQNLLIIEKNGIL